MPEYSSYTNTQNQMAVTNINIDRTTALAVLKDLSKCMYPSNDIFGGKTLVINRTDFEAIRKKYLDRSKEI